MTSPRQAHDDGELEPRRPIRAPREMESQEIDRDESGEIYRRTDTRAYSVSPPADDPYIAAALSRRRTSYAIAKTIQAIWYVLGLVEMLLGLRFLLKLIAANEGSPFVSFIYTLSYPLVWPFIGVVGTPGVQGGPVFEAHTLIAMLVYLLATFALISLLRLIFLQPANSY